MADENEPETFILWKEFLEEAIDPDSGLLDKLLCQKVLSRREFCEIKDQHPFYKRNSFLLQYIIDKKKYDCLITALKDTKQAHIVNYLRANGEYRNEFGDEWPLREAELSIFDTNQEVLVELLAPVEFVGQLYMKGVIDKKQRDEINSKEPCHKKNEALLEILRRLSLKDFKIAIQCLHETQQSHIAAILEQGGAVVRVHAQGLDDRTEDEIIDSFKNILRNRPIEESERIIEGILVDLRKGKSVVLYIYCRTLLQLMQLKEAQANGELKKSVQRLFTKLLNPTQNTEVTIQKLHNIVESISTHLFHHYKFDEIAVTLPMKDYDRCGSCFSEYIKIRAVHDFILFDLKSVQKDELINIIQSKYSNLETPKDEFGWNKWNFGVVQQASDSENSNNWKWRLNIYEEALPFKKGEVMEVIPPINIGDTIAWWRAIHLESGKIGYVPRSFVVIDYQKNLYQEYEILVAKNQIEYLKSATSNTSMTNLPFEVLDTILLKSYIQHYVLKDKELLKNKDHHVIIQLASVDNCWFRRIRKRKFKKELWRIQIVFHRRKEKISSIYRINRQYLEENIRLKGLVNRLKSKDCLTDVQTASRCRHILPLCKKGSFDRFRDLMSDILKKTGAIHSGFKRSLNDTKQHLIGEVLENGGATVKVEIRFRKTKNSELVARINGLQDNTKESSPQAKKLMDKLMQDKLKILRTGQDGDVIVVWIWGQSKNALEKLRTLNKSNDIIDVFTELVKDLSFSSEERNPANVKPKLNIDYEQFEKTIDKSIEGNDKAMRSNREFLVDRISTDFGPPEEFSNPLCLDQRTCLDRKRYQPLSEKIYYLKEDGSDCKGFGGDWPLNDSEIKILQKNHENLIDLLDTGDLLSHIYSKGVINMRQLDFIYSKPTSYERNEALLDILRRCSLDAYKQTIRCLHVTNQSHIAEILENGGVVVRVDASLHGEPIAMDQAKDEIIDEITNLLGNRSLPESKRILELVQLNLVAAKQGNSVALYFVCRQLSDVDRLQQMTKDGRLKGIIETVFNRLIKTSVKIQTHLKRIIPDFK